MKRYKLFIFFSLFLSSSAMAENWTRIFQPTNSIFTVYLDFDSVSRIENLVSAWTKADYDGYTSHTFTQVNCLESAVKYHSLNIYKNGVIRTYTEKYWYKFPKNENTIALEIYKRFC